MVRTKSLLVLLLTLFISFSVYAIDETDAEVELKAQITCPVMNAPINKALYSDFEGKRVYFCCGMCKGTFDAEPEKYLKILEDLGEKPEVLKENSVNLDG